MLGDNDTLLSKVKTSIIKKNSFSPAVNKLIISLRPGHYENIFHCGLSLLKVKKGAPIKVSIGSKIVKGKSIPDCVLSTSKKAKTILLNNLKRIKNIDCNKIISPLQKQSNCWFNTMFMTFFVSDKGRKFFRFFRQLMIEGKHADGRAVKPPRIANALFLFNLCIEASIAGKGGGIQGENIALTMDTNNVIKYIYDAIPKSKLKIYNIGESGNPLHYYMTLVRYLGNQSINIEKIKYGNDIRYMFSHANNIITFNKPNNQFNLESSVFRSAKKDSDYPDIIAVTLHDSNTPRTPWLSQINVGANTINKPLSLTFHRETDTNPIIYKLDSVIIRDTSKSHFSSCLTCNSIQRVYDGMSLSRMYNWDWKNKLNIDHTWEYKYKISLDKMYWNFTKCYQILFYYRT
jgi:hypothetical protein